MRGLRAPLVLALAALALAGVAASARGQEEVVVRAEVRPARVALGDTAQYVVHVSGAATAEPPPASAFAPDFAASYLGGTNQSTSVLQFDGRTGRSVRRTESQFMMTFHLRPLRAGTFRVPAVPITVGGKVHTTEPVPLEVVAPEPARSARLELELSPDRVYVEQPVELRLRVLLRRAELDGGWFDGDPWARSPHLTVPWFEGLPGFEAGDFQSFANSLLSGDRPGFAINGIRRQGMFLEDPLAEFALHRGTRVVDGEAWYEYSLTRELVPLEAGTHGIPVATLRGEIVREIGRRNRTLVPEAQESVFVAHDPVSLVVEPVPAEGRPPTYTHAVGAYRVSAEVSPRRAKVGDPLLLSLTVSGGGLLDRVAAPALDRQSSLVRDFAVSPVEPPDLEQGTKVFHYRLRPRHADVEAVPPLEFASFDPSEGRFLVATTSALPVEVEPAVEVGVGEVVGAGPATPGAGPGEELPGGLLANYGVEEALRDEPYRPLSSPWTWLLLIVPPAAFLAVAVHRWRRRAHDRDPGLRRAARALPRALEGVAAARAAVGAGDVDEAAARLEGALVGYVADRTGRPAQGLTAADARAALPAGDAARFVAETIEECQAGRYGGALAGVESRIEAAPDRLRELDREWPR